MDLSDGTNLQFLMDFKKAALFLHVNKSENKWVLFELTRPYTVFVR